MMSPKVVAVIQARMGSTRLPGKVLMPVNGSPMLECVINRVRWAVQTIVVATSTDASDDPIVAFMRARFLGVKDLRCYRGSADDVLDRVTRAAAREGADYVLRITADCPCVDPVLIQSVITHCINEGHDYAGIATGAGIVGDERRYPDGLDAEVMTFEALSEAWASATDPLDREHVTPFIWRNGGRFVLGRLSPTDHDYTDFRWTVDTPEDLELVNAIYLGCYREDRPFTMKDVLHWLTLHPEWMTHNAHLIGHEKYADVRKLSCDTVH